MRVLKDICSKLLSADDILRAVRKVAKGELAIETERSAKKWNNIIEIILNY